MVTAVWLLVFGVGCERLLELWLSRRHARLAFAQGGIEAGQGHFLPMRVLHALLLVGCLLEPAMASTRVPAWQFVGGTAAVLLAQALRYWAVGSLGTAWNVRVIVVPGSVAKRAGPYRYVRHPNYLAVVLEGLALPLACGAYVTCAAFFLLNAWLLRVRIDSEEQLLHELALGYAAVGGGR